MPTTRSTPGLGLGLELPPPDTKRWSSRRKAAIVIAIRTAVITREEARQSYLLSEEELSAWEIALDKKGIPGLRSGVRQSYGPAPARVEAPPVSHEIG